VLVPWEIETIEEIDDLFLMANSQSSTSEERT
jgi:hypothetical protein